MDLERLDELEVLVPLAAHRGYRAFSASTSGATTKINRDRMA